MLAYSPLLSVQFSLLLLLPSSSSKMVGRVVLLMWLEEELSVEVEGGMEIGEGADKGAGEGWGAEGMGDNSLVFTPGQGADDDFLPECGKKLEREREAATAPHS